MPCPRPSSSFSRDVKAGVAEHFARTGASAHANAQMVVKSLILIGTYFGFYAAILSGRLPIWLSWSLCPLMGVAMAGIGFSVAHDALHGAYTSDARVNRAIALLFEAIGANGYAWRLSHNGAHHTYPNVHGFDEDLDVTPLLRLSPHSPHRYIHRFQHLYAFPLYALTTLNWVLVKDYGYFVRSLLDRRRPAIPPTAWAGLFLGKTIFYGTMVAPFFTLHLLIWQAVVGVLTVHLTAGLIIGGVFQLAHVMEATEHRDRSCVSQARTGTAAHQLQTTSNFAPSNRLLCWYVGGLNFQVEHHLFPRMCHVHYARISPIVRQAAERHGLPYNSVPTLTGAVRSHLRALKALGELTSPPPPAQGSKATAVDVG